MDKTLIFLVVFFLVMTLLLRPVPEQPEILVTPVPEKPLPTISQIGISPEPQPERPIVLVWQESVNVHTKPELHSPVIGVVFGEDMVTIEQCQNGWGRIPIDNGHGWINGTCLEPNPCGEKGPCN